MTDSVTAQVSIINDLARISTTSVKLVTKACRILLPGQWSVSVWPGSSSRSHWTMETCLPGPKIDHNESLPQGLPSYWLLHDDVIKWKYFPHYWPFVQGIHRSLMNSPHRGQWRRALMFSLICARINGWVNNGEAGDLRRHRAHHDAIVMVLEEKKWQFAYYSNYSRPGTWFSTARTCFDMVYHVITWYSYSIALNMAGDNNNLNS